MSYYLNNPSYYRSHQFAHQFNLPDSALVNRKLPVYTSEMPQGVSPFLPSHKKHFQRLGYHSTISEENIINHQSPEETNSPAKNKDYYRNLSIEDIEGASTNTLISQALKNRIKAKEHYLKKEKQRTIEVNADPPRSIYTSESAMMQKQAERLFKRNKNEVNYHEKSKGIRTEPSQQQLMDFKEKQTSQMINRYKQQLKMTEREIQELEQRLQFSRKRRMYSEMSQNNRLQIEQKDTQDAKKQQSNQFRLPKINENQFKSQKNQVPLIPTQAVKQNQKQERKRSITQSNEKTFIKQNAKNFQIYPNNDKVIERETQNQYMSSAQKLGQSRFRKQQIRKMNPTYLSYGSYSADPNNFKMVYL